MVTSRSKKYFLGDWVILHLEVSYIKNPQWILVFFEIPFLLSRGLMMKRTQWLICLSTLVIAANCTLAKEKVILDTDMVELFDDGLAMVMLANSPEVDLLGVITVAGNTWAPEGTAYGLRQLEIIGRKDIPLAQGLRFPMRANRYETLAVERAIFGIGVSDYVGAFSHPEPTSWQAFYEQTYQRKPDLSPIDTHGVDFMIEKIKQNPDQVTIAAIGPCSNLAFAIRKAPEIIPMIKRVIYMGGAIEVPGNTTPAAEFNWWFDPESAKMCVRAPFKEQIVVGLDVTDTVILDKQRYESVKNLPKLYPELKAMFAKSWYEEKFKQNANATSYVWDLLVSAIIIDPSLITEETTQWLDVNTEYTQDYGRSLGYKTQGPAGTQKARIIHRVNEDKFWSLTNQLIQKP